MSTVDRRDPAAIIPLLEAGQRLDRRTFHERYAAMPPSVRAELIGGVVYMPSPLSNDHGWVDNLIAAWIVLYQHQTPHLLSAANATTMLEDWGEPQPDNSLRISPEAGGQTRLERRFIKGAPELVVEIARSSRSVDLGPKLADYERAGVLEYLVVTLEPDEIHWHGRRAGRLVPLAPSGAGEYHSDIFPGLWLNAPALFAMDLDALFATLNRGLATPEHADFVRRLEEARAAHR